MKKIITVCICVICSLSPIFYNCAAFGAILEVPGVYPTIQSGIDAAVNDDTVLVASGVYQENIDFMGKGITVTSQSGPDETIINGGRFNSVVIFWNSENSSAILNGFTITNGIYTEAMDMIYAFGGGISIRNASPIITNCTIVANGAKDGGGIHIMGDQASPVIENNLISGNIATHTGAGITARDGASPEIRNNVITENFTMQGSGIFISDGASPIIEGNTLEANDGGCCCMEREEALQFLDGVNIAENMGCGNFFPSTILIADQSSPIIRDNVITQNTSGGIGVFLNSSPTIDGNTISDNHGPHLIAGGLFVALDASPVIMNNTIQGNQGGALWIDDSSSILDGENNPISLTGFDVIEDADNSVSYSGNWDLAIGGVYSGGTIRMTCDTAASASLTFTGTGVSLIYFSGSNAGIAGIRIDGEDYLSVDMYRPDTLDYGKTEQVIATDLSPSEHILTITASDDPSSSCIALDAVGVLSGTSVGDNTVLGAVYWQPEFTPPGSTPPPGTTLLVPDHHASIQNAIDAAADGDTIVVAQGIYEENLDFQGKKIILRSQDPDNEEIVASTILDATEVWPTVMFVSGETRESVLEGFTLKNSLGERIVQVSGSSPTISKNIIRNATDGAINCEFADSPLITANTIESNAAGSNTVVGCFFSSPEVRGNTFRDNSSISISTYFSRPMILNNTMIDNQETPIYLDHFSTATISGNTISGTGPRTDHLGSGIVLDFFSDSIIERNTITDNQTDGIFMIIDSSPIISNNVMAKNGGGILISGSRPELINNTVVDNQTGILAFDISQFSITNSIFWNVYQIDVRPYTEVSVTYSNVKDGYVGEGNLSQDPLFAGSNDYHLSGESPCIDSGTPLTAPNNDVNGTARPQGSGYDMGAYEYDATSPEIQATVPLDGTNDVDVSIEVSAQFTEMMEASTLTTDSFRLTDESMEIPATVTLDGITATLLPETNLSFDTLYTATLSTALRDLAGNALTEGYAWSFSTCAGQMYYRDSDEDGYGDPLDSIQSCSAPPGYVTDHTDGCDADPNKTDPGQCGCGIADTDTDGDETPDCDDGCDTDPFKTTPGICGCGIADTDTDGDETADCDDGCDTDPFKTAPGICGCGIADTDTDGDETPDCDDDCATDPFKTAPGICGCGVADIDTDGDGALDCTDGCATDPFKTTPGICGCGVADTDTDGDGALDCTDGCATDPFKTTPGICGCGVADTDTDGDETADCDDGCATDPFKTAPGICGCGVADSDTDLDMILDCNDTDDDNDGVVDEEDAFPLDDTESVDTDEDGTGDNADPDDDGDGISDATEAGGPNSGDANYDGTPDSLQKNVACIASHTAQGYVVIESPNGTILSSCQAANNPSSDNAPANVVFDYGFFDFTISGLTPGGSTILIMTLPSGTIPDTYYKYGQTPTNQTDHWYEFLFDQENGAEINDNVVTLHFTDASRGDDVLTQDNMIIDLGAPGFKATDPGDGNDGDGGGGGGCLIDSLR
jgi:parallel beta-helix repeat protein